LLEFGDLDLLGRSSLLVVEGQMGLLQEGGLPEAEQVGPETVLAARLGLGLDTG